LDGKESFKGVIDEVRGADWKVWQSVAEMQGMNLHRHRDEKRPQKSGLLLPW
jgi:hypothetical protein